MGSRRVTAAQRGESPLITDTIYTIHSDKMDTSPLLQALRSESGDKVVRAMTDVNTGERTAVMSYDQMSYLLTVMVTISVVSILILIFSVTLILGFLWYTRSLLHRKCGCPGLSSPSSANVNILATGHQAGHPHQPPHWRHLGPGQPGQPHHQLGHGGGHGAILYNPDKLYRPSKHVRVNPLPPTLPATNAEHRHLVPSIKQSAPASERSSDNSIPSADYEINHTSLDEETGNETAEPIYAEIRAKEMKEDQHQPIKSTSEPESKQNKSGQNEHQETSGKKEIEYWQITAKEFVKFRPCTETFIVRE